MVLACIIIFIAAAIITASMCGGGVLCWLGMSWREVDRHPHCGRCEYDLTGLSGDGPLGRSPYPHRCPECGRRIGGAWSVRIGKRKPSPAHIALGLSIIALGAAPLAPGIGPSQAAAANAPVPAAGAPVAPIAAPGVASRRNGGETDVAAAPR